MAVFMAGVLGYLSVSNTSAVPLKNVQLLTSLQGTSLASNIKDFAISQSLKAGDPTPSSDNWILSPYDLAIRLTGASSKITSKALVIEIYGKFKLPNGTITPGPGATESSGGPYQYSALFYILQPVGSKYEITDSGYLFKAISLGILGKVNSQVIG